MPVPARSELTLTSQHDLAGAELEVFTLQGRSVLIQRASGSSAVLDVAALSAGIYVLHIRNGLSEYVTQFNVVH